MLSLARRVTTFRVAREMRAPRAWWRRGRVELHPEHGAASRCRPLVSRRSASPPDKQRPRTCQGDAYQGLDEPLCREGRREQAIDYCRAYPRQSQPSYDLGNSLLAAHRTQSSCGIRPNSLSLSGICDLGEVQIAVDEHVDPLALGELLDLSGNVLQDPGVKRTGIGQAVPVLGYCL